MALIGGLEHNLSYYDTANYYLSNNSGKKVVALKADDGNYTLLPYESYTQIKKLVKEEL